MNTMLVILIVLVAVDILVRLVIEIPILKNSNRNLVIQETNLELNKEAEARNKDAFELAKAKQKFSDNLELERLKFFDAKLKQIVVSDVADAILLRDRQLEDRIVAKIKLNSAKDQ